MPEDSTNWVILALGLGVGLGLLIGLWFEITRSNANAAAPAQQHIEVTRDAEGRIVGLEVK